MPTRRGVLAGVAGATSLAVAGCSPLVVEPQASRWLHAPDAVLPVAEWGFATLDAARVDEHRDALPAAWTDALGNVEDVVDAVSLDEIDRIAVQAGVAGPTRAAGSAALAGGFDAESAAADLREPYGGVERVGEVDGRALYAYAPAVLEDLQELDVVASDRRVDGTAGLAVGDDHLVVGAGVAPRTAGGPTGADAARAAVAAGAGNADRLAAVDDAGLALDALGAADGLVGARLDYDRYLETIEEGPERRLPRGLRLAAVGADLEGATRALLAYGDDRRLGPADVRDVLLALEDESALEVTDVGARQAGRAFVVTTDSDVAAVWGLLSGS